MMNELVRNQYDVTNHQVNAQFLLQLLPEWQRFVTLVKQSQDLKIVSYHKLYDILKQHQNKVNELRAKRIAQNLKPTNNNLRTSSNTSRANQDNSPRINRGAGYDNQRLEQADWRDDTNDESEDQELEAHYMYMAQIQEVTSDAADDSGPIFDTDPLQKDDDDDLAHERDLLASLIEKLKCEIDDRKNRNKFLETSNKVLVDKLKGEIEDFKTKNKSLESSNNPFKEANNKLSETNELMYNDLKKFQAELDKRNDVKYASKVKIDCAKAKGDLMSYKMES
uniref:Gag-Pol polyprotein n=1 Tax=Tanacetum cinerariifolium TaxID=118510 RepID=A0A699JK98_TANCI|nr:hypothetical protein [Tanacetum cinerariifolium]